MYTHGSYARRSTQGVKSDPHRYFHLKQACNSYIFKIYQKHQFLCGKIEKFEMAVFSLLFILVYKMCPFSNKTTIQKVHFQLQLLLLYYFYFTFILFVYRGHVIFNLYNAKCRFQPRKKFQCSSSLLLSFPTSDQKIHTSKISNPPYQLMLIGKM